MNKLLSHQLIVDTRAGPTIQISQRKQVGTQDNNAISCHLPTHFSTGGIQCFLFEKQYLK